MSKHVFIAILISIASLFFFTPPVHAQSCGTFAIGSDTCAAACPKNQVYGVQSNHAGSNGVLYCCGWTNLTPLPNANEQSCPALGYFDGTTCYLSDGRCYASQQEAQSQSYAQCQGNCVDSSWRQPLGGFECLNNPTAPMDASTNPRRYCCPAGTILQDDRCIAETAALPTCVNEGQKRCLSQTAFDFDLEIAGAEPACRSAQNSTNVIVCCPEGKTLDANQCVDGDTYPLCSTIQPNITQSCSAGPITGAQPCIAQNQYSTPSEYFPQGGEYLYYCCGEGFIATGSECIERPEGRLTSELLDAADPLSSSFAPELDPETITPGSVLSRFLSVIAFPFAGLILFVMIVWGGFEMMLSSVSGKKDAGRKRITAAVIGFFLLFCSYWIVQILERVFGIRVL